MNITVAVSGGTDSLFALLKLQEDGHSVEALHARFLDSAPCDNPIPALSQLCASLGIPFRVADLRVEFEQHVIQPFLLAHAEARTPNPCALCNRAMKFGLLLDIAFSSSCPFPTETLSTGHYVALASHPVYGLALKAGADSNKDQSYFLALTPIDRLRRCVFPLAAERKTDIRQWLHARNFKPPMPRESQEICFVPHDDHRAFLLAHSLLSVPGPVLLDDPTFVQPRKSFPMLDNLPVIAQHSGLWQYTEGQRKGLGIAWREPLFVLRRDRTANALIVGPRSRVSQSLLCQVEAANFLVPPELWPPRLLARTRYRQSPAPACVTFLGSSLLLHFADPQLPPAPGQVAAIYDHDGFLLAGGVIGSNP